MENEKLNCLADELGLLYKQDLGPFPYDDIAVLRTIAKKRLSELNPDLAYYNATLAGYCTWKRKILRWSDEKVQRVRGYLAQDFYEQHPNYLPLKDKITEAGTPDLYADMVLHEKMRQTLIILLDCLMTQRAAQTLQAVA